MRSAPVGVALAPRRVAQDRVRRERAALPGRQQERPLRVVARRDLVGHRRQLAEQLGDREVDEAVGRRDPPPRLVPVVVGEHDARRAGEDGVEQPVAGVRPVAEAGPPHAVRAHQRAALGERPQRGGARRAVGQGRPERAVQHDGRDRAEPRVGAASPRRRRRRTRPGRCSAAARSGARSASVSSPAASTSRAWISGSGSGPSGGATTGRRRWNTLRGNSKLKNVASYFSNCVERRQHVVGEAGRLGHEHVDAHDDVELLDRLRASAGCRRSSGPGCPTRRSSPGSAAGGR